MTHKENLTGQLKPESSGTAQQSRSLFKQWSRQGTTDITKVQPDPKNLYYKVSLTMDNGAYCQATVTWTAALVTPLGRGLQRGQRQGGTEVTPKPQILHPRAEKKESLRLWKEEEVRRGRAPEGGLSFTLFTTLRKWFPSRCRVTSLTPRPSRSGRSYFCPGLPLALHPKFLLRGQQRLGVHWLRVFM